MPSGGFTSPMDRETPVSTFTTIIPFVSMKVSITGQRPPLDKWAVLVKYRGAGSCVLRAEKRKSAGEVGRSDSHAMRILSGGVAHKCRHVSRHACVNGSCANDVELTMQKDISSGFKVIGDCAASWLCIVNKIRQIHTLLPPQKKCE